MSQILTQNSRVIELEIPLKPTQILSKSAIAARVKDRVTIAICASGGLGVVNTPISPKDYKIAADHEIGVSTGMQRIY